MSSSEAPKKGRAVGAIVVLGLGLGLLIAIMLIVKAASGGSDKQQGSGQAASYQQVPVYRTQPVYQYVPSPQASAPQASVPSATPAASVDSPLSDPFPIPVGDGSPQSEWSQEAPVPPKTTIYRRSTVPYRTMCRDRYNGWQAAPCADGDAEKYQSLTGAPGQMRVRYEPA